MNSVSKMYLNRTLLFILKCILIVCIILLLCVCIFFSATHLANLDVLVREGLKARAEVIFHLDETIDLTSYFTEECMEKDTELTEQRFQNYSITAYNQKIDMPAVWVWPWQSEVQVVVTDSMINLRGMAIANENEEVDEELPEWRNARYRLTILRDGSFWGLDSKWKITDMELLEEVEPLEIPTPPPSATIIIPTPTPSVEPSPSQSAAVTPALSPVPSAN